MGKATNGTTQQRSKDVEVFRRSAAASLAEQREREPLTVLEKKVAARTDRRDFQAALASSGPSLIAEHKRWSPSAGKLRSHGSVAELVQKYERGGASALSIITEEHRWRGSIDDVADAAAASRLPILRKDFIIDPYQLYQAKAYGADAVLLIVMLLERQELESLYREASSIGLDAIIEVHNGEELESAFAIEAKIIGINNRNLSTPTDVALWRTRSLVGRKREGTTIVSESGISRPEQITELAAAGVDAFLIGHSLLGSDDPEQAVRQLLSGSRGAGAAAPAVR